MKPTTPQTMRCAIYTRKSTEHNLDLAFNSLDAQREACEAYVRSQAHEGWRLSLERYDDGGLSGASLERPALQLLLAEVRKGKVDVIVVYKVDRLTRSLADFAKLVETFDAHDVSFVSVTQSFNTTSSMGRLTLNVLLSFAQFEREVIGERVRDKIAASKRKGLWVGGPVPFGYKSVAKTLSVVEEDAEQVRVIFRRYLALGSIGLLIEDLHRRGVTPKARVGKDGASVQPIRFTAGPLAYILKNRFYIGEVVYRGEVFQGQQTPIVGRELFEAVHGKLKAGTVVRTARQSKSPAFLKGLLFDDRGNRMSPSHANKKGVRYRYYVSQALLQNRGDEAGAVARVAAPEIEDLVVAGLRHHLDQNKRQADIDQAPSSAPTVLSDRELVALHVERIVLRTRHVDVSIRAGALESDLKGDPACGGPATNGRERITQCERNHEPQAPIILDLPWTPMSTLARKGVARQASAQGNLDPAAIEALLTAMGRARVWINDLAEGRAESFEGIARREGKVERHIRNLALLAFAAPRLIEAIANGDACSDLTVTTLARNLPMSWAEQEKRFIAAKRP
jgi:site-specific DNA recombinase